jgi:uncharacterized repeat protein (TIGR01451 family)
MSTQSNKPNSWFARLRSALGRKRRGGPSGQKRRGLRFESLETRSLLSATVLPSISGIVYEDPTGYGVTSNYLRVANVTVNLWRDGGAGVFEGNNPGSDDTLVGTATSDANGSYQFNDLSAGTYFVQQDPVPGLVLSSSQAVQKVVITSSDLQGTTGTTIDSFASTSQYVSGSLRGGKTGTSSQSTTDAIGGHRNLYVQLTTSGGAVDLGADSDWPGLLDYGADAASNGIFWVNWDGANSNPAVLDPTGLGGLDITSHGASTGIEINAAADHDAGSIMLKVYTDASDWSWASVPISDTGDGSLNSSDSQFVAFSSFAVGGGAGANFSQVGAVQLSINGVNAIDGQVGPIEAVGPMVFSENFVNLAEADLGVLKAAAPNPVLAGSQLTYTFTTTNYGPSGATGVTLSDTLPAGEQYVSSSGSQGAVANNNGTLSVQLGSLASGAVATTTVVVAVNQSVTGSLSNTVTVAGSELDPNQGNNTSTVTTQVTAYVAPVSYPELKIVKSAAPTVTVGSDLTYTLNVSNNSLTPATNVTVVDTLPTGFSYLSASGDISATPLGNTLTLDLGTMAKDSTDTITVVGEVTAAAGDTITNTATVSSDDMDPNRNLPDYTSSVVTTVLRPSAPVGPAPSKYFYISHFTY